MRTINTLAYFILLIVVTPVSASANGDAPINKKLFPYTATYAMKKKGSTIAELSYTMKQEQGNWVLDTFAKPKGLAAMLSKLKNSEKSVMTLNADTLQPVSYSRTPNNMNDPKNPPQQIQYQLTENKANYTEGENKKTLQLNGASYDSLSLQMAMMLDVMQNKESVSYQVIDDGQLETQQYKKVGKETIRIKRKQRYETIKYMRQYGNKEIHMWFAPELNYLLVKMQKYRKGKLKSELVLSKVNIE